MRNGPRKASLATALLALMLAAAACTGGSSDPPENEPTGTPAPAPLDDAERTVAIYSAVVRRLVTVDHTLGEGPVPFDRVFVVDGVVEDAADPRTGENEVAEPFPGEVRDGMKEELSDLPPVSFVRDAADVVVGPGTCPRVRANGALISLGAIEGDDRRVEVPNELYLACLGAQWLTYVVERSGDGWDVTAVTGPVEIA